MSSPSPVPCTIPVAARKKVPFTLTFCYQGLKKTQNKQKPKNSRQERKKKRKIYAHTHPCWARGKRCRNLPFQLQHN